MPKLDKDTVLWLTLVVTLVLSSYNLGHSLYLEVVKLSDPDRYKAVYIGLATAFTFIAGLLLMYAEHKSRVLTASIYSEKLIEEFKQLVDDLDKCTKECQCAANAFIRLLFMDIYIENIRRNV